MRLTFYGADKEVTGSCHCVDAAGQRFLVDCGLQQGRDERDGNRLPFNTAAVDFVIVTHAHVDHSGRLPCLIRNGFRGKIYATSATCRLLSIMLRDSAHIQEMDAETENRKDRRAGRDPVEPLYTTEDAEKTLKYLVPCEYGEKINPAPGITFSFVDAGHLLGSASAEVWLTEQNVTKKIVFSGDIGSRHQPIIRDPQYITEADYVVMESTYGDRDHEHVDDYTPKIAEVIERTMARGGNVVIPSFAVGRTQELLYFLREIKERGLVKSNPGFPVYVDSPLAAEATAIYSGDLHGYADEETIQLIKNGFRPIQFDDLRICQSVEESRRLNEDPAPKVIISSSGMCEAGRIRHHLKHNLWREECTVLFVGFQAAGTLGRILIDGVPSVKLFGEQIAVKAEIANFRALSAHADRTGLLRWISSFEHKPERVFVVHGEEKACGVFTENLIQLGYRAYAPNFEAMFDLLENRELDPGVEPYLLEERKAKKAKANRISASYARLLAAEQRLHEVILHNQGGANKDIAKFADQLISLCDKWDR